MLFASVAFASAPCTPPIPRMGTGFGPAVKVADPPALVGVTLDPTGERIGRVIHLQRMAMTTDEVLRWYVGVTTGPDGQPWLAGGPVTVTIDGVSLGEGSRGLFSSDRPVAETARFEFWAPAFP